MEMRIRCGMEMRIRCGMEMRIRCGMEMQKGAEWKCKAGAGSLWRRDAHGVGAAGADGAAVDGLERFVEADFDGGEVVVAATDGKAGRGDRGVGLGEEAADVVGRQGELLVDGGELVRDFDGVDGLAGEMEEGIGREAGAGAVGLPLVFEQAPVGIDVGVLRGVSWAGCVGAVFGIAAVGVLWPEAVQDEGRVLGALDRVGVRVAELGRPGEVEEVVVEVLGRGRIGCCGCLFTRWCCAGWYDVAPGR